MTQLTGITWDDPRGYCPLEGFASAVPDAPSVRWDRQPLAGFEAHPISELAQWYDLMVIDYPGIAASVEAGAVQPVDRFADLVGRCIGATWESYRYRGAHWAIPIDAATQVTVFRADLREPVPASWSEVAAFAVDVPTALCLGGPHALLTLLALAGGSEPILRRPQAVAALRLLQRLWLVADQELSLLDPIGVHDALAAGRVAYCPLVYGYARYADSPYAGARLAFADAPAWHRGGQPASVLGGTGIAISHRADLEVVAEWLAKYLDERVQLSVIQAAGGQPALASAWQADGYYSATRTSVASAWVRPRVPGWIGFQDTAGVLVREAIIDGADAGWVVDSVNSLYRQRV